MKNLRLSSSLASLAAAAIIGSAHFPFGISDGGRGTALRRGRRHRITVVNTSARRVDDPDIASWNAEVDRKKAEKRRTQSRR